MPPEPDSAPHIILVGAGAVGSLLAATLSYTKTPFTWVVRNPIRRAQLKELSLAVEGQVQTFPLDPARLVPARPAVLGAGWLILAVKAHQVEPLLLDLGWPLPPRVLVVANGLHERRHHLGLLYGGARLREDGCLETAGGNRLVVGPLPATPDWAEELPPLLSAPWLATGVQEGIAKRMWHKLALNCVVNPLSALLDCPNGALQPWLDSPLVQRLLAETEAVARSALGQGWPYCRARLRADLGLLLEQTSANSSSMREDARHGRETEILRLNLAVAEAGRREGLDCLYNEYLGQMICLLSEDEQGPLAVRPRSVNI